MERRERRGLLVLHWLMLCLFLSVRGQDDLCSPDFGYEKFVFIGEDMAIGTVVLTLNTAGTGSQVNLTMQENDDFSFNGTTQELSVRRQLDADISSTTPTTLKIVCQEADKQPVEISIVVTIKDINDNAPQFVHDHFYVNVSETMSVDQLFDSQVSATDADASFKNKAIYYTVKDGNYSDYFQFPDALRPLLVLQRPLDFETLPNMTLTVVATNQRSPDNKLSSSALLTVRVTDEDDLNPVFSSPLYEGSILETAQPNTAVNVTPPIDAKDADVTLNETVIYSFHDAQSSQKVFTIDNQTGEVRLLGTVGPAKVSVVVQATQRNNPSRYGVAMLVITVVGVNSNAPQFQSDLYQVFVSEALPPGTIVLFVSATDEDFGATIRYAIADGNTDFAIDPESGAITLRTQLDFETARAHSFLIRASDGNMESTATVEVTVVDANDNAPTIPVQPLVFDMPRTTGDLITNIEAHDADAETVLKFRLANHQSLFSIDDSGNLRVSAEAAELTDTEYLVVVIVSDQDDNSTATAAHETVVLTTVRFPPLTTTPPATTLTTGTSEKTTALPVAMAGAGDDTLAIALGAVAAVLLVVVIVLVIFLCRRRNQTSEQLDKAKVNRSHDPRGLRFKDAALDGPTSIQENPLSLKEGGGGAGGAFNHGFLYSDGDGTGQSDQHLDEIHIETAVIPYQANGHGNNKHHQQQQHHHHHPTPSSPTACRRCSSRTTLASTVTACPRPRTATPSSTLTPPAPRVSAPPMPPPPPPPPPRSAKGANRCCSATA
ncbi:cadherin-89D-like isoform X2 [Babylonia areolata]|uniref:cadherin-89D-like isoform X2 n=1 Tax=Babylonia areolata TaxID=304850 RepID=UPI003FD13222